MSSFGSSHRETSIDRANLWLKASMRRLRVFLSRRLQIQQLWGQARLLAAR